MKTIELNLSVGTTIFVKRSTFNTSGLEIAVKEAFDNRAYCQDGEAYTNYERCDIDEEEFIDLFGDNEVQFTLPGFSYHTEQQLNAKGYSKIWARLDVFLEIEKELLSIHSFDNIIKYAFLHSDLPISGGYIPQTVIDEYELLSLHYGPHTNHYFEDIDFNCTSEKYSINGFDLQNV